MDAKIFIGIPSNRHVKSKTVESLARLISSTLIPIELVIASEGYTIAENRAYLAWKAKEWGATHLLFIDDDMVFPPDTLDRLLAHGKDVVGVNAQGRKLPLKSTVTFFDKDWIEKDGFPSLPPMPTELFECQEVGAGIMLIDIKVFNLIEQPWFNVKMRDNGWHEQGEDGWFCEKVRKAGLKIYCDPNLTIGHIGDYNYTL